MCTDSNISKHVFILSATETSQQSIYFLFHTQREDLLQTLALKSEECMSVCVAKLTELAISGLYLGIGFRGTAPFGMLGAQVHPD